ncbi:high-potential iron-sulfur protein [Blastochloris sulfoviridis]|nr:high-potential iron-sulfur protein [Blastochloris sulfoviridis]
MDAKIMDATTKSRRLSRRDMLVCSAYVLGAGAAIGLAATDAEAQVAKKASHKASGYQESPKGAQRCDNCRMFVAPASCQVVEGKIAANGWCRLYAKKA